MSETKINKKGRIILEIVNNAVQEVALGGNVVFTDTVICGCSSIVHRQGSGIVKLRGLTNGCQKRARFKVFFGGNIAVPTGGTVGPISLAISIDGEPVETSRMIVTPAAVDEYFNVSSMIYLDVPGGCCSTIGVVNSSGPEAINVQNANLIVERVA